MVIEKFAVISSEGLSEFLDHYANESMKLVSLKIPKFAPDPGNEHWRTSESGH